MAIILDKKSPLSPLRKPPITPEEVDSYVEDIIKLPELKPDFLIHTHGVQGEKCQVEGNDFDSKWEAIFFLANKYVYGNVVERNKHDFLYYLDSTGKQRKFYYDFTLNGQKCEVKGRFRDSDIQKMQQCPEVKFYDGSDIKIMRKDLVSRIPDWESTLFKK